MYIVIKKLGSEFEEEIDLGERKISQMNYSFVLTLPKKFITSTNCDQITQVRLIFSRGCIIVIPTRGMIGDQEVELWGSKKE